MRAAVLCQAVVTVLCWLSVGKASEPSPQAVIVGPNKVAVGELAIFIVSDDSIQSMDWAIHPMTKNFFVDSSKRGAVLCGDGLVKTYSILLGTMTDGKFRFYQHAIAIGEASPPSPPLPPPPDPDRPLTGLSALVRDWVQDTVEGSERAVEAKALAGAYDIVTARMAAGTLNDLDAIVDATFNASREAVPRHVAWKEWGEKLRMQLNSNAKAGLLESVEDHITHWQAISKGLKAVK